VGRLAAVLVVAVLLVETTIAMTERSPPLTADAPRRKPDALVDHVASAGVTEGHGRGKSSAVVGAEYGQRVAEDGVGRRPTTARTDGPAHAHIVE
jgi:hypothetical protein